jgi:hypothetical protein
VKENNGKIFMTIVWKEREDGYLPDETIITSRDLRKYAPDFLVDFYESKMKFVEKPVKMN